MRTINGSAGSNTIRGGTAAEKILGNNGNDLLFGGGGNDILDGGVGNDRLYGDAGNDKLSGGAGDDRLYGGDGNDTLADSSGKDYFHGGAGFDTLDYSAATGRGVDVFLNLGIGGRGAAGDTYYAIENITGSKFQDFLWGSSANNVLNGGAGNDFLRGFAGNDTLIGGDGNDELYGDAGNDTFRPGTGEDIIVGGSGFDWVNMSQEKTALEIDFGQQSYSGALVEFGYPGGDQIDAEGLIGTNLDDNINLTGQSWNFTTLYGGGGNDVLAGAITFRGGDGEDLIRLNNAQAETVILEYDRGIDKIARFDSAGGDQLRVSKSEFGIATVNGNPVVNWVDTTDAPRALTSGPAFIYEQSTQILWFDGDGTGGRSAPVAIAGFYNPATHPTFNDIVFVG